MARMSVISSRLLLSKQFPLSPRKPKPSTNLSATHNFSTRSRGVLVVRAETMSTTIEKLGVKIARNPPYSKHTELGVRQWPKWGCPPSKFPWTYSAKETCYLLEGKVRVYHDGSNDEYLYCYHHSVMKRRASLKDITITEL